MLIEKAGAIWNNLYVVGMIRYPIYLFDGPVPVLFEGGISCVGSIYKEGIRSFLGDRQPAIIFLTHVHWDHCGAVYYLKRSFPSLRIAASRQAAEILQRKNAHNLIIGLNEYTRKGMSSLPDVDSTQLINEAFKAFKVDLEAVDGQTLDLGNGSTLEVLATPGHTRDHTSYYLPREKILIAGEAAGLLEISGNIAVGFVSDYDAYVQSLRRLAGLQVEILCQGHRLIICGREEVNNFLERSMLATVAYKDRIYQLLDKEKGATDRVIQRMKAEYYDVIKGPKMPEPAYLLNITAQVKHLAIKKEMGQITNNSK